MNHIIIYNELGGCRNSTGRPRMLRPRNGSKTNEIWQCVKASSSSMSKPLTQYFEVSEAWNVDWFGNPPILWQLRCLRQSPSPVLPEHLQHSHRQPDPISPQVVPDNNWHSGSGGAPHSGSKESTNGKNGRGRTNGLTAPRGCRC